MKTQPGRVLELLRNGTPTQANQALREFVQIYGGLVFGYTRHLAKGDEALASDLFQEVFLRFITHWRTHGREVPIRSFPKLLTAVARNAYLDRIRVETRFTGLSEDELEGLATIDATRRVEDVLLLRSLLENIDELDLKILVMTEIEGIDSDTAAKSLGLTSGALRKRKQRVLSKLKTANHGQEHWLGKGERHR